MANLLSYIDFVKGQASFHEKMATKTKGDPTNPQRSKKHEKTAQDFHGLLAAMEQAQAKLDAPSLSPVEQLALLASTPVIPETNALTLRPQDLIGLPPELLKQLKISEGDKLEAVIVEVINDAGGTIILDKLLIALYRKTNEVHQRTTLVNRLYRMSQKDLVFSVPKKKGVYTTNAALGVPASEESVEDTP
jgi:hypothetical protein